MDGDKRLKVTARFGRDGRVAIALGQVPQAHGDQYPTSNVSDPRSAARRAEVTIADAHSDNDQRRATVHVAPTFSEYRLLVESIVRKPDALDVVPVLLSRFGLPLGLPPNVNSADLEAARQRRGLYLVSNDPVCATVGLLLGHATGRDVMSCAPHDFATKLSSLARSLEGDLTLVIPYWDAATGQHIDPSWLETAYRVILELHQDGVDVCCGVLTGADSGALTVLAAKSLMSGAATSFWRGKPSVVVDPTGELTSDVFPSWTSATPPPFAAIRRSDPELQRFMGRQHGAIIFSGHGKSYCASHGYLCSARTPDGNTSDRVTQCHWSADCAGGDYGRVDPRQYDAALMVLHSCLAGSTDRSLARRGVPALALLAAAGSPTAVLATHAIAHGVNDLAIAAALAGAETTGDALLRLNAYCRQANLMTVFYLFGDPAVDASMWSPDRWFVEATPAPMSNASDGWATTLSNHDGAMTRVKMPGAAPHDNWCVHAPASGHGRGGLRSGVALTVGDRSEIWLPQMKGHQLEIVQLRRRIDRALPRRMVEAAEQVHHKTAGWASALQPGRRALLESASTIVKHSHRWGPGDTMVPCADPAYIQQQRRVAVEPWARAHERCLESFLEIGQNLWPWNLWDTHSSCLDVHDEEECPSCGHTPLYHHLYDTPAGRRAWVECTGCQSGVVVDTHVDSALRATLAAPTDIQWPSGGPATLTVMNVGHEPMTGAIGLVVSKRATVQPQEHTRVVEVLPGESVSHTVALKFHKPPDCTQMHHVFGIVAVDLEMQLVARQILVRRGE